MARKRVIYQSEALFVAPTGATLVKDVLQLRRVQSANYSFDISRSDVNQFGQLAAIDRIILEQPTVSLDFSYLSTDDHNETGMGLSVRSEAAGHYHLSVLAHILSGKSAGSSSSALHGAGNDTDVKNYFIGVATEGSDYNLGKSRNDYTGVIGLGNCQLTSYSVDGSVGDFVTASVSVEALNMSFDSSKSKPGSEGTYMVMSNPAVDPVNGAPLAGSVQIPSGEAGTGVCIPVALRPGNIVLTTAAVQSGTLGISVTDMKLQSFTAGFDLSRTPIERLGSKFAFARVIDFPTTATMDFSAIMGELTNEELEDLENIVSKDCDEYTIVIACKPEASCGACGTSPGPLGLEYTLRGSKLESQSFSSTIGDNKTVDMSFSTQIAGPNDTQHGLQIRVIDVNASAVTHIQS